MTKEQYIVKIQNKFPYICNDDLDETYEIAKRELFITLYSSNTSVVNENTEIPYIYEYKVLDAMKEIINLGNMRDFTSYRENGWSWERPESGLKAYQNIKSIAGVMS